VFLSLLPLLILILEEEEEEDEDEDDLDDDDDDDEDEEDETMYSDAKYVKKRELTISDIIFCCCLFVWLCAALLIETANRYTYFNPFSFFRFLLSLWWYLTKS
jgi:hypothetical protein